ncbi:cytochrome c5 family protein [Caenimonas koreensis]|uniref:Cytochrome c5 family protein n=1 Tax=Caenimonas koreensis DSM 17982 TaxID=1121255 RepID=A0A844AXJ3_9BURK|nr:c-type cytochrome [Caenimonas koreensis]MRD48774.1 cytochrome c5 family protein [Caenimonas koreensis DSM 17982]
MSDSPHEEAHTGPVKNPKQLLIAVFFSFVIPVFAIIGLVYYVVSASKPAGQATADGRPLAGVTTDDLERAIAARIRKVGSVEIRDANRPLKPGEEVFKAQCTSCHTAGVAGAPKFADAAAWAPRIKTGYDALLASALKGKGNMPAQAGGDFDDIEIGRAVAYMANAAGAKFAEPDRPAAAAAASASAPAAAAAAAPAATAAPAAATVAAAAPAAAAAPVVAAAGGGAGEALYKQACVACHGAGLAGSPKFGDKAAWAPRIAQGIPVLVTNAIKGKNAMPPKGGSTASDADIKAAVEYMVSAAK